MSPQVENVGIIQFLDKLDFAQGKFLGDDPKIDELGPRDRAYVSAWRHGCPRPDMVIAYYGNAWAEYVREQGDLTVYTPEAIEAKGIEYTRRRYDECDFVFGVIKEYCLKAENYSLYLRLTRTDNRVSGEPLGVHEEGRVPEFGEEFVAPLSRLVGFALPRVLIEQFGWGFGVERDPAEIRYMTGLRLLEQAVKVAKTPEELLARLANLVIKADAPADNVLDHMLEPGIEAEENNHQEFARVRHAIRKHSPTLYTKTTLQRAG